jgi:hypothetical protein
MLNGDVPLRRGSIVHNQVSLIQDARISQRDDVQAHNRAIPEPNPWNHPSAANEIRSIFAAIEMARYASP